MVAVEVVVASPGKLDVAFSKHILCFPLAAESFDLWKDKVRVVDLLKGSVVEALAASSAMKVSISHSGTQS